MVQVCEPERATRHGLYGGALLRLAAHDKAGTDRGAGAQRHLSDCKVP